MSIQTETEDKSCSDVVRVLALNDPPARFIDAGYSGDWSRIEAITPEYEQGLRDLSVTLGELHIVAGLQHEFPFQLVPTVCSFCTRTHSPHPFPGLTLVPAAIELAHRRGSKRGQRQWFQV